MSKLKFENTMINRLNRLPKNYSNNINLLKYPLTPKECFTQSSHSLNNGKHNE